MKKIAIFGSTGSIGKNTIEVIKNDPKNFRVTSLVAKNDYKTLISQALSIVPEIVVIENDKHFLEVKYDGEKHLVVNILKDGSPVLVPMSVIDDECYAVGLDELE